MTRLGPINSTSRSQQHPEKQPGQDTHFELSARTSAEGDTVLHPRRQNILTCGHGRAPVRSIQSDRFLSNHDGTLTIASGHVSRGSPSHVDLHDEGCVFRGYHPCDAYVVTLSRRGKIGMTELVSLPVGGGATEYVLTHGSHLHFSGRKTLTKTNCRRVDGHVHAASNTTLRHSQLHSLPRLAVPSVRRLELRLTCLLSLDPSSESEVPGLLELLELLIEPPRTIFRLRVPLRLPRRSSCGLRSVLLSPPSPFGVSSLCFGCRGGYGAPPFARGQRLYLRGGRARSRVTTVFVRLPVFALMVQSLLRLF